MRLCDGDVNRCLMLDMKPTVELRLRTGCRKVAWLDHGTTMSGDCPGIAETYRDIGIAKPSTLLVAGEAIRGYGDDVIGQRRASGGACRRLRDHQCGARFDHGGQLGEELGRNIEGGEQFCGGY